MMRKTIFGITLSVCLLVLSAGALAKQIIPDQNAFTDNTIQGILADNAMPFFLLNKIDKLDKSEPSPTVPDPLKALATATPTAITIAESTKDFTKLPTQKSDLGISGLSVEGIWRINKGQAKLFGWYYGKSVVVYCFVERSKKANWLQANDSKKWAIVLDVKLDFDYNDYTCIAASFSKPQ